MKKSQSTSYLEREGEGGREKSTAGLTCIAILCFRLGLTVLYGLNEERDPNSAYSINSIGFGLKQTPTRPIILG